MFEFHNNISCLPNKYKVLAQVGVRRKKESRKKLDKILHGTDAVVVVVESFCGEAT